MCQIDSSSNILKLMDSFDSSLVRRRRETLQLLTQLPRCSVAALAGRQLFRIEPDDPLVESVTLRLLYSDDPWVVQWGLGLAAAQKERGLRYMDRLDVLLRDSRVVEETSVRSCAFDAIAAIGRAAGSIAPRLVEAWQAIDVESRRREFNNLRLLEIENRGRSCMCLSELDDDLVHCACALAAIGAAQEFCALVGPELADEEQIANLGGRSLTTIVAAAGLLGDGALGVLPQLLTRVILNDETWQLARLDRDAVLATREGMEALIAAAFPPASGLSGVAAPLMEEIESWKRCRREEAAANQPCPDGEAGLDDDHEDDDYEPPDPVPFDDWGLVATTMSAVAAMDPKFARPESRAFIVYCRDHPVESVRRLATLPPFSSLEAVAPET